MLGHKVSREKTYILFSQNVSKQCRREICRISQFKEVDEIGKYLGVNISFSRKRKEKYRSIVGKIKQQLNGWKAASLSLAGWVTLVKSVTSLMALFHMQHDKLLTGVIEEIERVQRSFLWDEQGEERKCHAISWSTLCKPTQMGGLGIKSMTQMNQAFCLKLLWRMFSEPNELWVQVIKGKYGRGI